MKKYLCVILILILVLCSGCSENDAAQVKLVEIPLTQEEYAFGVDKNQPELLQKANAFIEQMLTDGTFDEICEKYFEGGELTPIQTYPLDASKDQLVVATNTPFEPFEYMQGASYYGVDLEIAAAFAESLGQELVIMNMDFSAVCLSVAQGKCDIAMAGLTVTEDRQQSVNFTVPYYEASQTLIVRAGDTTFDSCKSAAEAEAVLQERGNGITIGVQSGTTGQFYVQGDEDWGFEGFNAKCVGYKSAALAVQNMLNGNVDYVITDRAPAESIVQAFDANGFSQKIENFFRIFIQEDGWKQILGGLQNTMIIAVVGLLIGTLIGMLIGAVRVVPKYKLLPRILDKICSVYVGFFRGTPIVVQLLLGYYVLLPALNINCSSLSVCVVVFGLNSGAYVSEIMRGGIASVDGGQLEAGRALGLGFFTSMRKIVIPQAIKNILPTLGNEFISLIKETSVVSFVGTLDIYVAFDRIGSNDYEYMVPYLAMALVYIVLVAVVSALVKLLERRLARSDRNLASK